MSKKTTKPQQVQNNTNKWIIPVLLVAAAVIVGLILILGNGPVKGMPASINVTDAMQRFEDGAFLLDVRTVEEWNQGHVDGAVLIPLDQLGARVNEVPKDQDVLIICRSGNRSGQARDLLRGQGFDRTTSISGGINAWIAKGLPVVTGP
mgnify:CR=1 FL=1